MFKTGWLFINQIIRKPKAPVKCKPAVKKVIPEMSRSFLAGTNKLIKKPVKGNKMKKIIKVDIVKGLNINQLSKN